LHILQHAAANPDHGVIWTPGANVFSTRYRALHPVDGRAAR
jgi:hypothetical protein